MNTLNRIAHLIVRTVGIFVPVTMLWNLAMPATSAQAASIGGTLEGQGPGLTITYKVGGETRNHDFSGVMKLRDQGGHIIPVFCIEVTTRAHFGDRYESGPAIDNASLRWLLVNYGASLDLDNLEASARQFAVWAFSDGVDPSTIENADVQSRAVELINEARAHSADTGRTQAPDLKINPSSQAGKVGDTLNYIVSAGQAYAGESVNLTISGNATFTNGKNEINITLDNNGNSTFGVTGTAEGQVAISSKLDWSISAGTILNHVGSNRPGQRLVIGQEVHGTATANTAASFTKLPLPTQPDCLSLSGQPNQGLAPLNVSFTGTLTNSHLLKTVTLSHGDGTSQDLAISNNIAATHTYTRAGDFKANLVLTTKDDHTINRSACTVKIHVERKQIPGVPDCLSLVGQPTSGIDQLTTSFTGVLTNAQMLKSLAIDYGDGTSAPLALNNRVTTQHTYGVGDFVAQLILTTSKGQVSRPQVCQVPIRVTTTTTPPPPPTDYQRPELGMDVQVCPDGKTRIAQAKVTWTKHDLNLDGLTAQKDANLHVAPNTNSTTPWLTLSFDQAVELVETKSGAIYRAGEPWYKESEVAKKDLGWLWIATGTKFNPNLGRTITYTWERHVFVWPGLFESCGAQTPPPAVEQPPVEEAETCVLDSADLNKKTGYFDFKAHYTNPSYNFWGLFHLAGDAVTFGETNVAIGHQPFEKNGIEYEVRFSKDRGASWETSADCRFVFSRETAKGHNDNNGYAGQKPIGTYHQAMSDGTFQMINIYHPLYSKNGLELPDHGGVYLPDMGLILVHTDQGNWDFSPAGGTNFKVANNNGDEVHSTLSDLGTQKWKTGLHAAPAGTIHVVNCNKQNNIFTGDFHVYEGQLPLAMPF